MIEDQLTRRGFDDVVTGLPSRSLFIDRLEHAMSRLRRRDMVAVLLIEVERSDQPDAHQADPLGDELLVLVGRRLELALRPGDTLARLGGDEFTILLEDLDEPNDVATVCERIIGELARPFELRRQQAYLTVTIGASFGTTGRTEATEVLRTADAALHRARVRGENRYVILGPP